MSTPSRLMVAGMIGLLIGVALSSLVPAQSAAPVPRPPSHAAHDSTCRVLLTIAGTRFQRLAGLAICHEAHPSAALAIAMERVSRELHPSCP